MYYSCFELCFTHTRAMHACEWVYLCLRVLVCVSFAYFDEGLLTSDSTGIDSRKSLDDFILVSRPHWVWSSTAQIAERFITHSLCFFCTHIHIRFSSLTPTPLWVYYEFLHLLQTHIQTLAFSFRFSGRISQMDFVNFQFSSERKGERERIATFW